MTPRTLIHTALLMAVIAALGVVAMDCAPAAEPHIPAVQLVGGDATARFVTLGIDKSVVLDLPRDIKDVLVGNSAIANAVIRSSRRAYIIGRKVGQTDVFFFDADGKQIAGFDIAVTLDLNGLRAVLKRALPGADVDIEGLNDGVELSGNVATPIEAQKAFNLASRLVGSNDKVVNDITVHGSDQVMLKVTVAEMDRNVIKQLGINLSGSAGKGAAVVNFNTTNPFPVNGTTPSNSVSVGVKGLTATLQAMEQTGVVRTLAEPTLTAISGEAAHFLAGGMFPYPIPSGLGQPPGIAFQNFGVALNFTPVVLSEGRISLHVATEVSQLDPANSVTVAGTTVPGLVVRRAETTAEISSGGTLAMAGLLEDQTKQAISGFPGLQEVPILGALFKSRDYLNNETELVVLVTPYIERVVAQKDLSRPDDGFANPSDPASVLLGTLNRIYGVNASPPSLPYHGKIGFILD